MAESIRYIESTSKKFYQSQPANHGPDGPQEIKLRGKYITGGMAPNWNRHSDNSRSSRQPGPKRGLHDMPPKVKFMPDAGNGHTIMIAQSDFFALTGIRPGFN
jgi:hypothetical protein